MRIVFLLLALSSLLFGGDEISNENIEQRVEKNVLWKCGDENFSNTLNAEDSIGFQVGHNLSEYVDCRVVAINDATNMKAVCSAPEAFFVVTRGTSVREIDYGLKDIYNKRFEEFIKNLADDMLEAIKTRCQMGKVSFE